LILAQKKVQFYKQWVQKCNIKIVSTASTAGKLTETHQTAYKSTSNHYKATLQATYPKILKETILPDYKAVILLNFSQNYSSLF
jgi:hypothetical protein